MSISYLALDRTKPFCCGSRVMFTADSLDFKVLTILLNCTPYPLMGKTV